MGKSIKVRFSDRRIEFLNLIRAWPQALQSVTGTWLRPLLTTQCSHVRVALS